MLVFLNQVLFSIAGGWSNLFCRYFASAPKRLKFGDDDAPQTPPAADIDSTIGFPKQPNTYEPPASNAWVDPQRYVITDHRMHIYVRLSRSCLRYAEPRK